ncbi:MAG: MBL fold metallo-hydrolase [Ignisphaera sp.]|nr:MBL fold metallo-hydrolase [Ignisphaera sp.]MCX8168172.1 MBL fold metallo-hydrolase [Ignisphaera sp.]MDW8085188.1 MBL fold metallo-hydrolase [Ignisphaera sp.]
MALGQVRVDSNGAIEFPYRICIDGHGNGCLTRVVTHIHADHTLHLDKSIVMSRRIIGTPITIELLNVLGYNIPSVKAVMLNYGDAVSFEGAKLRFEIAQHIPGTAQVVLHDTDFTTAYTSDFKNPGAGTKIIKDADVLVIDATYGDPKYSRVNEEQIWEEFIKMVKRLLTVAPVAIYAYYGKAHEVMSKLREAGIDAPFILSHHHWKVNRVLSKFGYNIRDIVLYGSRECEEIKRDGWFIEFHHTILFKSFKTRIGLHHIFLTGRFVKTIIKLNEGNCWIIGISGHADFNELMYYIDEARPRLLVVDGFRSSHAEKFAEIVRERLSLRVVVSP